MSAEEEYEALLEHSDLQSKELGRLYRQRGEFRKTIMGLEAELEASKKMVELLNALVGTGG